MRRRREVVDSDTGRVYRERDVIVGGDRGIAADREDVRSLAGINFLLGIWLIISPWILNYSTTDATWNQVGLGIAVLILSAIRYIFPRAAWASWLNGLIGLWLIIAPFILGYDRSVAYWNEIILGIIIAILAFSNMQTYGRRHHRTTA